MAAVAMAAIAGDGVDALRSGVPAVGKACGACHKVNRAPKK